MELEHKHLEVLTKETKQHNHQVNGYRELLTHRHYHDGEIELGSLDDRREYIGIPRRFPEDQA